MPPSPLHSPVDPTDTDTLGIVSKPDINRAPKKRSSDVALRALKPTDKPYKHSVGEGLYLEVMPSGSKLWRWKYRIEGKENRYAMGSYPQTRHLMSLSNAPLSREIADS